MFRILCVVLGVLGLFAGEGDGPKFFSVYQEQVKPSMVGAYEEGAKAMIAVLKEKTDRSPYVRFNTISNDKFLYTYVTPIENFAALDSMRSAWDETFMSLPPEMQGKMMESMETVDHVNTFVVGLRPELSYSPENMKVSPVTAKFFHYSFYYVLPGKEQAWEAVAKGFKDLMAEKKMDVGFSVYQKFTGEDLPAYAVIHFGNTQTEIMQYFESFMQTAGEKGQKLAMEGVLATRKHETIFGMARPDLSLE